MSLMLFEYRPEFAYLDICSLFDVYCEGVSKQTSLAISNNIHPPLMTNLQ